MAQGWIELGDFAAAERAIRACMEAMDRMGDLWAYSSAAWMLPGVVARQGRREETLALVDRVHGHDGLVVLDADSAIYDRWVAALGLHLRGRVAEAEVECRAALDLAAGTELAIRQTMTLEQLADIVEDAGRRDEARQLRHDALAIHETHGNQVGAARVRALLS